MLSLRGFNKRRNKGFPYMNDRPTLKFSLPHGVGSIGWAVAPSLPPRDETSGDLPPINRSIRAEDFPIILNRGRSSDVAQAIHRRVDHLDLERE